MDERRGRWRAVRPSGDDREEIAVAERRARLRRFSVLMTAAALAVGACQTNPSPSTAPQPSGGTSASETPTEAPSPSPAPDVSAAFTTAYAAIKTGILSVNGTVTVGQVQVSLSGSTTFSGPDS